MSGSTRQTPPPSSAPASPPPAKVRRSRFSLVWLIPLVALVIAAYLGVRTVESQGPLITITWKTGDGIVAGTTKVEHKAVTLGQVEGVRLSDNLQDVSVTVRMRQEAAPYLTDQARFWVVRPRLSSGSISGIETLVSGSYIEMDPGSPEGKRQTQFTGLENPPGVRSGEPGKTFELRADRLGSLSAGAPVFWRDITVGEVLGYDIGNGDGPVTVTVFVRAPYDGFVRQGSHFWNASGLSVSFGPDGVHLELASLQAVLSGGVAFDTPRDTPASKEMPAGTQFQLYKNYQEAQSAGYRTSQAFVSYFESDVSGLASDSPVDFFGIQVGTVTNVSLDFDPATARARVKVRFDIQPQRVVPEAASENDSVQIARRLVARGLRAELQTSSYLTGAKVLALTLQPDAPKADLTKEGDVYVIPSVGGGLDNILSTVSDITTKINKLPLDEIAANLNGTLKSANAAMGNVNELVRKTDTGLSPVLARMPALMTSLQEAVARTGRTLGSIDQGYGKDSQFSRDLERAMVQVGDTARSIRLLADYLDRHPEALIRGRTD
jgi:paraquat-inducible protein B